MKDKLDSGLGIADKTATFGPFVKYLVANISTAVPLSYLVWLSSFICVDILVRE